ncbi:MAG TPA: hypothetical protein VFE98_05980 [Candidatus Bathyarchaeia archaeon]|nr:hypothetical protein [Candidatus Bathyarchaeia archaeon]
MPVLKLSDKPKAASIPIIDSRIPKTDELIVLGKPLLDTTVTLGEILKNCTTKWAIGGDVAEVISGVNVEADHLTILTTKEGCDEISGKLAKYQIEPPRIAERKLARNADIDLKSYPVWVRSYNSRFGIQGTKLVVHGNLQIKVGDWEWGDPLDFEPDYVHVVNVKVPIVPLKLKNELYAGLGWMDRANKIQEAVIRSRHKFG